MQGVPVEICIHNMELFTIHHVLKYRVNVLSRYFNTVRVNEEAIVELEASVEIAARDDGELSAGEEDEEATDDEQDVLPSF
jgi:hypothetical protein